jgi:hypothetical protein
LLNEGKITETRTTYFLLTSDVARLTNTFCCSCNFVEN